MDVEAVCSESPQIVRGGCYLCQDIIHDILSRVPKESLVRFKSVCKNWCNIISEIEEAIARKLMAKVMIIYGSVGSRNRNLFFKLNDNGIDSSFCFERENIWAERDCKNFVLFRSSSEEYGNMYFVYDAIKHQYRKLPKIFELELPYICSLVCDASGKTCKVIVFDKNRCGIYNLNPGKEIWNCMAATLTVEKWRRSEFPCSIMISCSSIDLNGVFYWMAKGENGDSDAFILPLDIATEEFISIIKVPCQPWRINCNLLKIKGSLCFMNTASVDELHIWVLKDSIDSLWILQHKISFQSMVHRPNCLTSFMNDSFHPWLVVESIITTYILVTIKDISTPYWYNMETKKLSQITVDYNNLKACRLHTFSFIGFDVVPELEDLGPELEYLIPEDERPSLQQLRLMEVGQQELMRQIRAAMEEARRIRAAIKEVRAAQEARKLA